MMGMLRGVALFAAYSTIGFGGDYVVGLLDRQAGPSLEEAPPAAEPVAEPLVVVEVAPTVVSRVAVRHGDACAFRTERELTVPASEIAALRVRAGAGDLHVEGRRELREVVVVGLVCASHEEYLDELEVTAELSDEGALSVVTHYPESRARTRGENTARIDLTVLMPLDLPVDVEDSSGEMEISGTGDLRIDDSSGSMRVHGVNGRLVVDDSSGEIEVFDVRGDVEIEDGSGGLHVRDVEGGVLLRDGSGGIELFEIGGDVRIESDGSGGIEVRDVGGDFIVERDGSGGIRHTGVQGRVEVPSRRRGR